MKLDNTKYKYYGMLYGVFNPEYRLSKYSKWLLIRTWSVTMANGILHCSNLIRCQKTGTELIVSEYC